LPQDNKFIAKNFTSYNSNLNAKTPHRLKLI